MKAGHVAITSQTAMTDSWHKWHTLGMGKSGREGSALRGRVLGIHGYSHLDDMIPAVSSSAALSNARRPLSP